jgi:hypothetical protein
MGGQLIVVPQSTAVYQISFQPQRLSLAVQWSFPVWCLLYSASTVLTNFTLFNPFTSHTVLDHTSRVFRYILPVMRSNDQIWQGRFHYKHLAVSDSCAFPEISSSQDQRQTSIFITGCSILPNFVIFKSAVLGSNSILPSCHHSVSSQTLESCLEPPD